MKIALDAMGSDEHPVPDVAGAILASQEWRDDTVILVGDAARVKTELARHQTSGLRLEVVHAAETVSMTDHPAEVGKSKPNSSMHVGMNLVKKGHADAFVTAGNTGAVLAIATLYTLRRIRGVKRPALSAIVRVGEQSVILLDIGANTDSKPTWLVQFAIMGKIYAQHALGLPQPRVGLLSNGEEEGKGDALVREASKLLRTLPLDFVGNIEPKEIFKGRADVIVSDGFVGNIAVKSLEASASTLFSLMRTELTRNAVSKLGAWLARPALRRVYKQVDPFEIGGAPLLGVNGVVIIGHGRSTAVAIKNAIRQARLAASGGVVAAIREGLERMPDSDDSTVEQE